MHAYHYGASLYVRRRPKRRVVPGAQTAAGLRQALQDARVQLQVDLAQRLQLTPRAITALEQHTDMYINNLWRCMESGGSTLAIAVHFPDGLVIITYCKDIDPTFRL
jgi:hypothetical protein